MYYGIRLLIKGEEAYEETKYNITGITGISSTWKYRSGSSAGFGSDPFL